MSDFIYAIENVKTVTARQLEDAGLAGIFGKVEISQRYSTAGPGGECVLFASADIDVKLLHFSIRSPKDKPDEQTWKKGINGKYHIGFYNGSPPTERILQRKKQLAGHEVELADGNKWLVPVARIITGKSALPQSLILGKNGEVFTEALPKYTQFSSKVEKLWEDFSSEIEGEKKQPKLTFKEQLQLAVEALAFNYRVGMDEVNILKLFTTQNFGEVLAAIIDIPTLMKAEDAMNGTGKA